MTNLLPGPCIQCGRQKAVERQYWYAMGRLHKRSKPTTSRQLREVLETGFCWVHVTTLHSGPSSSEYAYALKECQRHRKYQRVRVPTELRDKNAWTKT